LDDGIMNDEAVDRLLTEQPVDRRCDLCRPDGRCDVVALRLGICGMARLLDAIGYGDD
jgi:hypothetical protein